MKQISNVSNLSVVQPPNYVCSSEEFQVNTDAEDGSTLEVVDEDNHKVISYHLAYHGKWNQR